MFVKWCISIGTSRFNHQQCDRYGEVAEIPVTCGHRREWQTAGVQKAYGGYTRWGNAPAIQGQ